MRVRSRRRLNARLRFQESMLSGRQAADWIRLACRPPVAQACAIRISRVCIPQRAPSSSLFSRFQGPFSRREAELGGNAVEADLLRRRDVATRSRECPRGVECPAALGRCREQLCKASQRALFVPPHEERLTPGRLLQVGEMYRVVKPGLAQQLAHRIERTLVDDMEFAAAIDQYPHRTVQESAMLERRFKLAALKAPDFFVKPAIGLVQALLHGLPLEANQCREPR